MSRIISGEFAGLPLVIDYNKYLRPSTDKVKESIFNIIQFDIKGSIFLDLFSGTGQIGIEAISRGAKKVYFVEKNNICLIKKNLDKIKNIFNYDFEIIKMDVIEFLKKFKQTADIVFLDPPYDSSLLDLALSETVKIIKKSGIIITECPYEKKIIEKIYPFMLKKRYSYGKISINVYKGEDL